MSDKATDIANLLAPTVVSLGLELLGVEYLPAPGGATLRLYIDVPLAEQPERIINVDDCERVSREVSAQMDVEDPISGNYTLEVSSPGVDRPLKTPAHFARFIGEQIEIALKHPFQGRKHYKGVLCASPDGTPEQIEAGQAWGLLLAPAQPKAPLSRTAAKKQAKAVAKGEAPVSEEVDQVMGFTLDEIREARLVPVVSFKGRRAAAQPAAGQVAVDEAEELGGQKK